MESGFSLITLRNGLLCVLKKVNKLWVRSHQFISLQQTMIINTGLEIEIEEK